MFDVLLSVAASFSITFLAIPVIITVAERKKLYDIPDDRKIHKSPIPSLGGLGIYAGFVLACLVSISFAKDPSFQYFLAATFVIFFLGLKDDILVISPIKKFIGQVLAAFLIIYKGGIQIESMGGFLGIYELPETFSLLLTYFTILVVINSFNLIDGVDGLAGSLGLMSSVIFGLYFWNAGLPGYAIFAFALAGSVAAFLLFNFQPARIFMGDTGSMLIGMVNAVLVVKFINVGNTPGGALPLDGAAPAVGFIILMIPLLDTLRVFAIRMLNRRSPFSPDRNHVHHLLLDKRFSHRAITITLVSVNLCFITGAFFFRGLGCTFLIAGTLAFFFAGISLLYYTRRPRLFVAKAFNGERTSSKVVPLTKDTILEQKN